MTKGIILFQSKYGATKRYADWLIEETGFDLIETKKAKIDNLIGYDTIILGGGIYASNIAGIDFLRKNINSFKGKKNIVFCVGASPYDDKSFKEIYNRNFKDTLSNIKCFYCRGSWNEEVMTLRDKILCKFIKKMLLKKDPSNYEIWETALMESFGEKCDWTDKKNLDSIIKFIKE